MIIQNNPKLIQVELEKLRLAGHRIGLVPTMGYLHSGHLSLVRAARRDNTIVVVSIFVNPIQFGPKEDLAKYPRDIVADIKLLENEAVDYLFLPEVPEMYPAESLTSVLVGGLQSVLCGVKRPGHFDGVTTVVAKLFNILKPHKAYFGLKDYQQYLIIKKMVVDLNFDIEICGCPIVREADGLAMSSRNAYLSDISRSQSINIFNGLQQIEKKIAAGDLNENILREEFLRYIETNIDNSSVDYFNMYDAMNLSVLTEDSTHVLIAAAVFVGSTRLLDNLVVNIK